MDISVIWNPIEKIQTYLESYQTTDSNSMHNVKNLKELAILELGEVRPSLWSILIDLHIIYIHNAKQGQYTCFQSTICKHILQTKPPLLLVNLH